MHNGRDPELHRTQRLHAHAPRVDRTRVVRSPAMKRTLLAIGVLLAFACRGNDAAEKPVTREPVSVRGWIADVKGSARSESPEIAVALRQQMFGATSVWVENAPYASGGVAENGAFIILDVPPGNVTIGFNAPGAEDAKVVLQNVPGNADIFVPGIILERGGATVLDPKAIRVRIAAAGESVAKPTDQFVIVVGHRAPIIATPLAQLTDRRDYPNPGGIRPIARVK